MSWRKSRHCFKQALNGLGGRSEGGQDLFDHFLWLEKITGCLELHLLRPAISGQEVLYEPNITQNKKVYVNTIEFKLTTVHARGLNFSKNLKIHLSI